MRSMTGFGRARVSENGRFVSLEISTVNNRHLNVNVSIPTDPELEQRVEDRVKERIHRGNVDIQIESNILGREAQTVDLNRELVRDYLDLAKDLTAADSDLKDSIGVVDLFSLPGVLSLRKEPVVDDEAERMFMDALEDALDDVVSMRAAEGEQLQSDLRERVMKLQASLKSIEERFPEALKQYRERLRDRFEDVLSMGEPKLTEELEDEITRYADKCDISEEIVRVDSHISQFIDYLESNGDVGKNLKFLLQEMQREVNTIGAKGNDADISHLAVEMKTQLEKCKEQVKNVE